MGPFSNLKKFEENGTTKGERNIAVSLSRANEILRIGLSVFMAVFITRLGIAGEPHTFYPSLSYLHGQHFSVHAKSDGTRPQVADYRGFANVRTFGVPK